jgi:hypothetical protein
MHNFITLSRKLSISLPEGPGHLQALQAAGIDPDGLEMLPSIEIFFLAFVEISGFEILRWGK